MTKGDNNAVDDTALYPEGHSFVYCENVVELVVAIRDIRVIKPIADRSI